MNRPASLKGWPARVAGLVDASGETVARWSEQTGLSASVFRKPGPRPNPRTVIVLDDFCAGHLLSPAERTWAEQALAAYRRRHRV